MVGTRNCGWVIFGLSVTNLLIVGPLLGGWLFDLQGHYGAAFLLAVALVCVAIGCMRGVRLTGGQAPN